MLYLRKPQGVLLGEKKNRKKLEYKQPRNTGWPSSFIKVEDTRHELMSFPSDLILDVLFFMHMCINRKIISVS